MTVETELPLRVREATEPIRFFLAENSLGVGRIIASARADVIYAGHPRSPINVGDLDADWLPTASELDLAVIPRDKHIRFRPAERAALAEHALRVLALTGAGNMNVWDQLTLLVRAWEKIEEKVDQEPGPWMYSVTKAGLRALNYPT